MQHSIISRNLRAHSNCAYMVTWLGVTCFADFHIYYIYLRLCLIFRILYNTDVVLLHHCTYSSNIIMHLYISLGFYAFQNVFFVVVIYDLGIINSSCFISGCVAGKLFTYWHCLLICSSSNQLSGYFIACFSVYYCNAF